MKKIILLFAVFITVFFIYAPASYAENSEITNQTDVSAPKNFSVKSLTDRDFATDINNKSQNGFYIQLDAKVPIKGIYLIWNTSPETLEISCGENYGDKTIYKDCYLHQFITVDGFSTLQISWKDKNAKLAEIYVFSEGEIPGWVQRWEAPCEKADLLLFPTHADDDFLFFGGTIPTYAGEKKLKVQVAYMTSHETERQHELLNALWHSGNKNYPVIPNFKDIYCKTYEQAKERYDSGAILEYFVTQIRRFKPEVIIGHDLNGEYGHGAHILNANLLIQAAAEASSSGTAGDPGTEGSNKDSRKFAESYAKYGAWQTKKLYLHLYDKNKLTMMWDTPLSAFGGKTGVQMAKESYEMHVSQQGFFKFSLTGKTGCAYFGLYSSTVGDDVNKNDFLENIPEEFLSSFVKPEPPTEPKTEAATSREEEPTIPAIVFPEPEQEQEFSETTAVALIFTASALIIALIFIISKKRNI